MNKAKPFDNNLYRIQRYATGVNNEQLLLMQQ